MANLDRIDGDIDTLMARIAHIRTWTYITHRGDWVEGADGLAGARARYRGPALRRVARPHHPALCRPPLGLSGAPARLRRRIARVGVGGGRGSGRRRLCRPARRLALCARCDRRGRDADAERRRQPRVAQRGGRARAAARRRCRRRLRDRCRRRCCAGAAAPSAGSSPASGCSTPRAEPLAGDFVEGDAAREDAPAFCRRSSAARSSAAWRRSCRFRALPLGGVGRGLAFQLVDALGSLPAREVSEPNSRRLPRRIAQPLSPHGVRFGTETVYVEPLLRPEALRFRALLWAVRHGRRGAGTAAGAPARPRPSTIDPALPPSFYAALGFRRRRRLRACAPTGSSGLPPQRGAAPARVAFAADAALAAIAGVEPERVATAADRARLSRRDRRWRRDLCRRPRRRARHRREPARGRRGDGHPFAKLQELKLA